MPSGKTHFRIEVLFLVLCIGFFIGYDYSDYVDLNEILLGICGYCFAMFFFSPDLDLFASKTVRRWGVFRFIWRPYAVLFRHRGISHSIFFGSASRVIYLAVIVYATFTFVGMFLQETTNIEWKSILQIIQNPIWLSFFAGIWLNDTIHVVLDWVG